MKKQNNSNGNGTPKPNGLKLSDFATPLAAKNNFIKASIGGFAGSGKTFTATQFIIGCYKDMKIKKPLLLIDNEKGSRFLIPIFEKAGIKTLVKDTVKLADVLQAMDYLESGEIGFLFIDTLTKVWVDYVRDYRKNSRKPFMTLQDWGKILPAWQEEFSDRFVNAEGNFVFTGRGGFEYEKEEDVKDAEGNVTAKGQFVKSGVKMKLAGETPFEPDLNIWMELSQKMIGKRPVQIRTATIFKDRSNLIDGKVFDNPTYKCFQPVVKFLIDVRKGEVAGVTNDENIAPHENHTYYQNQEAKEIQLELITNAFAKHGFSGSQSKEVKALGIMITEKIFETSSMKEIEKTHSPYMLKQRRIVLEKVLSELDEIEDMNAKKEHINELDINDMYENKAELEEAGVKL